MKILIYTPFFHPSIGGLEIVTDTFAKAFENAGHEVVVITSTPNSDPEPHRCYRLVRRPSFAQVLRLVKACDVFMHNSISLRMLWPLLVYRRPWIVVHQMVLFETRPRDRIIAMLKRRIARFAVGVAISRFMAVHYRDGSIVIPNPIDVTRLIPDENCHRDKDIVFVGRLIADKGVHVLLEAISLLAAEGHVPVVSIIGDGPERSRLVKLRDQLGLSEIVEFSGALSGSGLTESICRHKVMAIPSVWTEPFGIVALEGLACGCALVASDTGGLPDAVGSCGLLVPPNDAKALAKGLRAALDAGNLSKLEIEARRRHLAKHSPDRIAERYVRLFLSQTRDWNCGAGNLD